MKRTGGRQIAQPKNVEPVLRQPSARWAGLICLVLLVATFAVYLQVYNFGFLNYDDPDYVTDNAHVRKGLTRDGVAWAFTTTFAANWFPLTWLSHMLDVQLFGLQSGRHHLVNVLLHAIGTLLLFGFIERITGAPWKSAFVAFVFALHPLHVESVAWIAERKDVLNGVFWFLTLWMYLKYTRKPGVLPYASMLLLFCCGLMSKQMIVTLPFVALLLDFWPLKRFQTSPRRIILEKLPLFGLAIAASLVAYLVQQRGGAISSFNELPFALRMENALVSYCAYIARLFWPVDLAVFYPFPASVPLWQATSASLALAGITAVALISIKRRPYLTVGWLWYLITLSPVIGIIQIGLQSRADRYTYIPLIGIAIMLAWGLPDLLQRFPYRGVVLAALSGAACSAWLVVTWHTVPHWRNSISLFSHAIRATDRNFVACNNLGAALRREGRLEEAMMHFEEAIAIKAQDGDAQNNLGEVLLALGKVDDATPHIMEALRLQPDSPAAHVNLGAILNRRGRFEEAEAQYRMALLRNPDSAEAHCGLGACLSERKDRLAEALQELLLAVSLKPEYADAHYNLGRVLGLTGRTEEAKAQFSETIRIDPSNAEAHFNIGIALAAQDRLADSLEEYNAAIRINPGYLTARFNLGSTLGTLRRYDEAIAQFSEILRLKPDWYEARQNLETCVQLRAASKKE
jgi:protein O-mannosyl-transferase